MLTYDKKIREYIEASGFNSIIYKLLDILIKFDHDLQVKMIEGNITFTKK